MPSRLEKSMHLPKTNTKCLIADQQSSVAVIATHPWGPLGGNMNNNVVAAAVLYFQRLGLTTARFDFNGGIGRGYSQVEQLLDVAQSLRSAAESRPLHFILVGYSYGSLIAASASADMPDCIACISIAPPFSVQHWLLCFNSSYHLERATTINPNMPRLLLIGTQDNFTSEKAFKDTVETKYPSQVTTGAVIKGADHFFHRREKDVMDVIGQWLLETFSWWCHGDLRKFRNLQLSNSPDQVS